MMNLETLNGIFSSALVILASVAIQFRNSSKAQRRALRELRDREVEWALYVHSLRTTFAVETGKKPPELPNKLQVVYSNQET